MAARAVWQRSANRFFVQEDAKRAPKLACCPSTSSLLSKSDTKPATSTTDVNDDFASLNDKSFYSNLLSDSKWWLQMQPDYMYQRGLTSEQVNTSETQNSHQFVDNDQDGSSINSMSNKSYEFVEMDSFELPWWQMGEKNDFTSFVSKKSNNLIDKYDLPKPMDTGLVSKPQMIKCSQSAISVEVENVTSKPIREIDSSKSKILEALCHSQTRARKAENAAKEALAEKEHVIKLLFRQASQLFAYRQWVYLLQLENLCYQMKNNNSNSIPSKNVKLHKNLNKVTYAKRKRTQTRRGVGRHEHDIGKYAVVFVVGLGIVGAGLLLGWTVGWMLI